MKEQHLSEEQVQLQALGEPINDPVVAAHFSGCDQCRRQVDEYALLFTGLHAIPRPEFAFDVASLVMPQLPQPAAKRSNHYLIPVLTVAFLAAPAVVFRTYFVNLLQTIPALFVYPMLIIPVLFIVFRYRQMYRAYQQKIDTLAI